MEKQTVHIVFEGIYSDRDIAYVASSRKNAEKFVKHQTNQDMEIIEYEIDAPIPEKSFYNVRINGITGEVTNAVITIPTDYLPVDAVLVSRVNIIMGIEARDAHHAIKIASERMMMIKAEPYLFPQLKDNMQNIKYNFYTKELIKL